MQPTRSHNSSRETFLLLQTHTTASCSIPDPGDPQHECTGKQLALGPTQVCVSPSEPTCTDPVQGLGGDLPSVVVDTITSARATSVRRAYAWKWNLFVEQEGTAVIEFCKPLSFSRPLCGGSDGLRGTLKDAAIVFATRFS